MSKRPKSAIHKTQVAQARARAHDVFDQLFLQGYMSRDQAYCWLARSMGMTRADCHFRFFDFGLCEAAIGLVREKLRLLKRARGKLQRQAKRAS